MSLPEVVLDDRTFQDLVSEARMRIASSCPEWTEHNVSDPGITLIELFAWMTDVLLYRVNRIPEKLHVALLELLGIRLAPPAAATTDVRFRLAAAVEQAVEIPIGTEVGTRRTGDEPAVVFQLAESRTVEPLRPTAYVIEKSGTARSVAIVDGCAKPTGEDRSPFGSPPEVGDALLLGFDHDISRLLMLVEVDGSAAHGAGVDPDDPPLRWDISTADGGWREAAVLQDSTGGFNYGSGAIELELPREGAPQAIAGQRKHWLRCRLDERTRSGMTGASYSQAPDVLEITATPVGAVLAAAHASSETGEQLGLTGGTPGETFSLRHSPLLPLQAGETVELREPGSEEWETWDVKESFAESGREDRHVVVDLARGEVEFGPAVRQPDGGWRQYGKLPSKGSAVRFSRYRHGGGRGGNVAAETLIVLKSAIPGVRSVVNPGPALGGVDAETLDAARQRAALEIRSRDRAVTVEDFELLALKASPQVARSACVPTPDGGTVRLHVLPRIEGADRLLSLEELTPSEELLTQVASYIDERRLLGTTVELMPVKLRGVSVVVDVQAAPFASLQRVEQDVDHALTSYLNPLIGGDPGGPGDGWPFGRTLNQGELYGIVHAVRGVEFVKILRVYGVDLATEERSDKPLGSHLELDPDELLASAEHVVRVSHGA